MTWLVGIAVVLVLGTIAVVAAGRGGPLAPAADDDPDDGVPARGRLSAEHLRQVRFPLALRGYRMADVDALLDRVARERDEDQRESNPVEAEPLEADRLDEGAIDRNDGATDAD